MPAALVDNLLVFVRQLREAGVSVPGGRVPDLASALALVDLRSRTDVYHACRTLLVQRHDDFPRFDRAFHAFWRAQSGAQPAGALDEATGERADGPGPSIESRRAGDEVTITDAEPDDQAGEVIGAWSDVGGLADKDFAALTADEADRVHAALARLSWTPGFRRTRRWTAAGQGRRIDLRRALARSRRTGGELLVLPRRQPRLRERDLVLVCDVSGSMERYSRILLHFAHALGRRHRRIETFLFSTTLTRITLELRHRQVDAALSSAARAVTNWSGGTRIGESLRQLHQQWGRRVLTHGPVVLLVSDGWDRGDPAQLAAEVARLQRSSRRLIWLNPLIGTDHYAPLTRGLQAALPYVDDFVAIRTLRDLMELTEKINAVGSRQ